MNYGGRFNKDGKPYNFHYIEINKDEARDYNYAAKVTYNQMLPHYQLGYALLNQQFASLLDYIDPTSGKAIENSHNTMHNNMHFSMIDGNFSLTNLMFFCYHSWIDLQLEMKIRMCNNEAEGLKMRMFL